jgi:two-component system, NarL family, nitrate/nitrite response regulator NarL
MANAPSIVIVDDHPVVRDGVADYLRNASEFRISATCRDANDGLDEIRRLKPDLALIDFQMPGLDGLSLFRKMKAENLATKVLFFSSAPTDAQISTAVETGASGILLKDVPMEELLLALKHVAAGGSLTYPPFVREAIQRNQQRLARASFIRQTLTVREMEILMLAAAALSNKEIGTKLGVVEGTIKLHLHSIYRKLGIGSRVALIELVNECREQLATDDR